ncbi:DUF4113 domain-containing protein [Atlantibacter sp.]
MYPAAIEIKRDMPSPRYTTRFTDLLRVE